MELDIRMATAYGATLADLLDLAGVDPEEVFGEEEEE